MSDTDRISATVPNEWLHDVRGRVQRMLAERGIEAGASVVEAVSPPAPGTENPILYVYDRSGSGKRWDFPVRHPAAANSDADAEARRIVDALIASRHVTAVATDGPMKGVAVPFPGEDYIVRIVESPNGKPSLIIKPGHKPGRVLGYYRLEDDRAVWTEGDL